MYNTEQKKKTWKSELWEWVRAFITVFSAFVCWVVPGVILAGILYGAIWLIWKAGLFVLSLV